MPKLGLYSSGWQVHENLTFGASDFWRLAVPGRELARNGWDIVLGRQIRAAPDGRFILVDEQGLPHGDCDVVLMQRYMGDNGADAIRRARSTGQVVANDVDDYYWALPQGHSARNVVGPKAKASYNIGHYRDILKASSLVTVSTPWLAKALGKWNDATQVVRNYVALDKWALREPGKHVGWVGVIPWRSADLQELCATVVPWLKERGRAFYHGGDWPNSRKARDILGYDKIVTRMAVPLPEYANLWNPVGVAVVPLDGSTFNQAKSWCKGLEACARGVPFISSRHSEYEALGVGRIARRPYEWAEHLDALEDPAVYAQEAKACRARAEELSIERNWQEWDSTFRGALSG